MLLIPLSKKCSRGDQIENAKLFTKLGYAQMIEEEDYNFEKLSTTLKTLLTNSQQMKSAMKKALKTNASDKIVELIKKYEK